MHKSFDLDKPVILTFDLGGEQFAARQAPGWMFIDFARIANEKGPDAEAEQAAAAFSVFEYAMTAKEYERFADFCRDNAGVSIAVLMELMSWLCEGSVQERPTPPPSGSSRGRETTGDTSEDGSSSRASNGARSRRTSSATSSTP